jgi:hypothetical protein
MTLGEFLAALTALVLVAGVTVSLIKSLIEITVNAEFESVRKTQRFQDNVHDKRLNRIERRIAVLEIKVLGDTDTFSGGNSG